MKPGNNKFNGDLLNEYHDRFFVLEDEKASIMGAAMNKCAQLGRDQNSIVDEAKEDGIPKKEFRMVIGHTRQDRKIEKAREKQEAIREEADPEQQDTFDQLMQAMGMLADTPLGQAAADNHPDAPAE
jgi:hypothetical protein